MSTRRPTREELERLMKAAESGDIPTLQDLIQNKRIDVNTRGSRGDPWWERTALLVSARNGHSTAVNQLLKWKAKIHAVDQNGNTSLHLAARSGSTNLIEQFIKAGIKVNAVSDGKITPLHYAAASGKVAAVELLLRYGAAINQTDSAGWTPLRYAVINDQSAVVWTLINDHKADISHCDEDTKQKISKLLAIEEDKRKAQQDSLSSSKEETADSVVTTQAVNDCSTACTMLRKQYDVLIYLPVKTLLPSLYAKEVIDFDQKQTVEAKAVDTDKMGFILDLIIRSLKAGVAIKYNSFLKVLKDSKDSVANEAVKNLAPILTTTELSQNITAQEDSRSRR